MIYLHNIGIYPLNCRRKKKNDIIKNLQSKEARMTLCTRKPQI